MGQNRFSGGVSAALEASLIGLVMAGCVALGYFIGHWLDGRFDTTYWTPIMVVVGAIAGMQEMVRTVSRIVKSFPQNPSNDFRDNPKDSYQEKESGRAVKNDRESANGSAVPERRKPRFFRVPPPPTAEKTEMDDTDHAEENQADIFEEQLAELRRLQKQIDDEEAEDDERE